MNSKILEEIIEQTELYQSYESQECIYQGLLNIRRMIQDHDPWISVKDRFPEDTEQSYLGSIDGSSDYLEVVSFYDNNFFFDGEELNVTHWMPLPEGPKQ